jgi:hypothetical protein
MANRFCLSIHTICLRGLREKLTPPFNGNLPPLTPVPPPFGATGVPDALHNFKRDEIASVFSGLARIVGYMTGGFSSAIGKQLPGPTIFSSACKNIVIFFGGNRGPPGGRVDDNGKAQVKMCGGNKCPALQKRNKSLKDYRVVTVRVFS